MKTLTKEQVFQQMADNVRAGKSPVDRLQLLGHGLGWSRGWMALPSSSTLNSIVLHDFKYRLEPRTHTLNGYDVPAPETEEPEVGADCFVLNSWAKSGVDMDVWENTHVDRNALRHGLWLSKEDAIANAKALRGEDPYDDSE